MLLTAHYIGVPHVCSNIFYVAYCSLSVSHVCYVALTTHYNWVSCVCCMLLTAYRLFIYFVWLTAQHNYVIHIQCISHKLNMYTG